ncbi:MAG: AEC family transporter [Oscillospiraceae bacterium]|nr:AEC family transporter [Oscillospiraceae bacterium]
MLTVNLALELLIFILVGLVIQKLHVVNETFDQSLSSFLLRVALPCMIIDSLRAQFSAQELVNAGVMVVLALLTLGASAVVGVIAYRICGGNAHGRILRFSTMFCNFSFMGMPVIQSLYGQQGLFYFVVLTVPIRMIYYSSAKPLLSPPDLQLEHPTPWQKIRGWFSAPVIGVIIGLILYVTQLPLPSVVEDVISGIGSVASPMGMILCGLTLGKYNLRKIIKPRYLLAPLLRNGIMPAVTLGLMVLLPVPPELGRVVVMYSALPVASMLAAFTIQYDPSPTAQLESAGSVLYSTLLSAGTIPVWAWITGLVLPV